MGQAFLEKCSGLKGQILRSSFRLDKLTFQYRIDYCTGKPAGLENGKNG
jgi:hypothetical protein